MIAHLQIELYFCSIDLYSLPTNESYYLSNKLIDLATNQQLIPGERVIPHTVESTFCSYVPVDESPEQVPPSVIQSKYNELIKFEKKVPITHKINLELVSLLKTKNKGEVLGELRYTHKPLELNSRVAFGVQIATKYKELQMKIIIKSFVKNIQCKLLGDEQMLIRCLKETLAFITTQTKPLELEQRLIHNNSVSTPSNWRLKRKSSKINLISNQMLQELRARIVSLSEQSNFQFQCNPAKYFHKISLMTQEDSTNNIYYKVSSSMSETAYHRQDIVSINSKQSRFTGVHLIVFVHGLNGSNHDLKFIKEQVMMGITGHKKVFLSSRINQTKTDLDIDVQGRSLAKEVERFLETTNAEHISFVSHSLGGLVVRAALPYMYKLAHRMHSYITLSTPHFGFIKNNFLSFGLRLIGNSSKSIAQLLFQDQKNIEECYIYRLASFEGLNWFKILVFFSSKQDKYVQYQSSKAESAVNDDYSSNMERNMFKNSQAQRLVRVSVDFDLVQKSFDDFIGRTAHLKFLEDQQFANKFVFIMNTLWNN